MSRESRESIENGYEVTITRYNFLPPEHKVRVFEYLTKNYFQNKCLIYANEKF